MQKIIYALFDPRNGEPKYVGSTKDVKARLEGHLYIKKGNIGKIKWIRELRQNGMRPDVMILESAFEKWKIFEACYVGLFKGWGFDLYNRTVDGGSGTHKRSEKELRVLKNNGKGRTMSEEGRLRLIEYNQTRIVSDQTRKKMSVAKKGIKLTESHRLNGAKSRIGLKKSVTTIQKSSAARKAWWERKRYGAI